MVHSGKKGKKGFQKKTVTLKHPAEPPPDKRQTRSAEQLEIEETVEISELPCSKCDLVRYKGDSQKIALNEYDAALYKDLYPDSQSPHVFHKQCYAQVLILIRYPECHLCGHRKIFNQKKLCAAVKYTSQDSTIFIHAECITDAQGMLRVPTKKPVIQVISNPLESFDFTYLLRTQVVSVLEQEVIIKLDDLHQKYFSDVRSDSLLRSCRRSASAKLLTILEIPQRGRKTPVKVIILPDIDLSLIQSTISSLFSNLPILSEPVSEGPLEFEVYQDTYSISQPLNSQRSTNMRSNE